MLYNFDVIIDRKNTCSIKYDFAAEKGKPCGLLPMWVADMDFQSPPEVLKDLQKTLTHGIFGYTEPKDDYYNALSEWFNLRYNFHITKNDTILTPGVVFAISQALRAFTKPEESILIQTPVYYPFYNVIKDNKRKLVTNPLVYDDGKYKIDFLDFEKKIKDNNVKLFILCSPHNPAGRVWTREELEKINDICKKYNVIIISDEIHCDFVWNGYTYTCFGLINEDAIIATSPSKTFNLAGLQVSNIFVKNKELQTKLKKEINKTGYSQLNTMGLAACRSSYEKGGKWLEELKTYIEENIRLVQDFLSLNLPKIKIAEPQAMYLLWLDFSQYGLAQNELNRRITENAKLWLSDGIIFGEEGRGFQRINIACPRAIVREALERLKKEFSG